MKISVVIPAYNEAQEIENTIRSLCAYLPQHWDAYEVVVVNDGSGDETASIAAQFSGEHVTLVSYEPNRGKGYAVRQGMLKATGDIVFYTDADLAYGLDVLDSAVDTLQRTGADIVIGSRKLDKQAYSAYPFIRKLASKVFSCLSRMLTGMRCDTQCGFKGFRRMTVEPIFSRCTEDRFSFDFEVMMLADRLRYRVAEMPVRIINHRASRVNVVKDSIRMLRDMIRIRSKVKSMVL